jgi:hypothetical protein
MARKGFEIAVSTLVILVLGIIIVSGGILLLRNISSGSNELVDQITTSQRAGLRDLLNQGQLVAVYPGNLKIAGGKSATAGLIVLNTHDARPDGAEEFIISHRVEDEQGQETPNTAKLAVRYINVMELARNEQQEAILVVKPAEDIDAGAYTVIVTVTDGNNELYDSARFFTVRVQ